MDSVDTDRQALALVQLQLSRVLRVPLIITGWLDAQTITALRQFQLLHRIVGEDGRYGDVLGIDVLDRLDEEDKRVQESRVPIVDLPDPEDVEPGATSAAVAGLQGLLNRYFGEQLVRTGKLNDATAAAVGRARELLDLADDESIWTTLRTLDADLDPDTE